MYIFLKIHNLVDLPDLEFTRFVYYSTNPTLCRLSSFVSLALVTLLLYLQYVVYMLGGRVSNLEMRRGRRLHKRNKSDSLTSSGLETVDLRQILLSNSNLH